MRRLSCLAAIAVTIALSAADAMASQGPGTAAGTASDFTQMAMAVGVYGTAAAIIVAGLIGAARRR
jgi:hypothetical protein